MKKLLILILTVITILLGGCNQVKYDTKTLYLFQVFGDIGARLSVIDYKDKLAKEIDTIETDVREILSEIDDVFSANKLDTVIWEINSKAGIEAVEVPEEVIFVIKEAIKVSEMSLIDNVALYDITIFPIWNKWNFIENMKSIATIPTQAEIDELLPLVDYKNIIIDEENSTVFLKNEGMKIDLGSIAKGYAGDKIKEYLLSVGVERAVIDVGAHISTMGYNYDFDEKEDVPWKIKIRTPQENVNYTKYNHIGYFYETNISVITSGTYERYIISDIDGKEYHHILDPRTGFPMDSGLLSITIISEISMIADALSTAVFNLGLDKGMELIENNDELEAVFVDENKNIYISSGLEGEFTFNEETEKIGYSYKGVYNGIID